MVFLLMIGRYTNPKANTTNDKARLIYEAGFFVGFIQSHFSSSCPLSNALSKAARRAAASV